MNWILLVTALCSNENHSFDKNGDYLPKLCQVTVMNCVIHKTKIQDDDSWKQKQATLCYVGWDKIKDPTFKGEKK